MSSMRTRSPSTATSRMTPRSTSEMTGISGSGISSSAAQTCIGGHHCAPGTRAPHLGHLLPELCELGRVRAALAAPSPRRLEPDAARELGALLRLEHAERVRPQLLDRRRGSAARRAAAPPTSRRAAGGRPPRGRSSPRGPRAPRRRTPSAPRAARGRPPRRGSGARSCAPSLEQAQLDERRAAVLVRCAVERERVGVGAELDGGELVERARVADLVLRDRRERDVLLERRRDPRPLRVAPAEDQLVVSEAQEQLMPARSRASFNRALIE